MKEILQKIELFAGLDRQMLSQIASAGLLRRYRQDDVIVERGETGLGMFVVIRGSVRVLLPVKDGPLRELTILGPEQVFAEMALLDEQPRSARVVAAEDVECLLLTRDSFAALMRRNPELPIRVARVLAGRLRQANERWLADTPNHSGAAAFPMPDSALPAIPAAFAGQAAALQTTGVKSNIQGAFLSMFENFYTMKAMTRFSVAVLGCPVEGSAPNLVERLTAGEVKALILPAREPSEMRICAQAEGHFTLHLFTPGSATPLCWGPESIRPEEDFRLRLDGRQAELRRAGRALCVRPAGQES